MHRPLGNTGEHVCPIAFGAFKIGRNQNIKYPQPYDLPSDREAEALLLGAVDLGINLIDTAPAYGISESRIGQFLGRRRDDILLATKIGERFHDGQSVYDFSAEATERSIDQSLATLRTDRLDIVHIHSDGRDLEILQDSGCVEALLAAKAAGKVRFIGLSGKTVAGFERAAAWADTAMVELSPAVPELAETVHRLAEAGVGVLIKKAFAAGRVSPEAALRFSLERPGVASVVAGSLSLAHLRENVALAKAITPKARD